MELEFGLIGGAVADRVEQRRVMWVVDVVRGLLVAGFAGAVALDGASIALLPGWWAGRPWARRAPG
ncbi:hypothetical protein RM704_17585 [Streptomyces sp. DSM 3412]|uniref:Major facilitator superfamily (MFS) profile domain-containing protein n=1 Tax=Streptomyces gottesmaniae TaxID=3075518 RepID=A0ABU2YY73_9ACTN|nr:hypothetical protein [Streptomyces sp. DSM 3412]MDT0569263.1 hypothetical protein [Streptomyces sp. DSM 3412]